MSVGPAGDAGGRHASRWLASVPWVVVLLGVGLLGALLLVAIVSFRGPERQAVPPPAPPMLLPTLGPTASPTPASATSPVTADPTATPTPTPSDVTPSPQPNSASPATMASAGPPAGGSGSLTARYRVQDSDRDSFEAELLVDNQTAQAREWRVELVFGGNVKGIQVSGGSGVSVETKGTGWYVVRGTSPLDAGDAAAVQLRFTRNGTGDKPGECTVNGGDCVIG